MAPADRQLGIVDQCTGGIERIVQLPQVARPAVIQDRPQQFSVDLQFTRGQKLLQHALNQGHLVLSIAQRRQLHCQPVQTVIQILAQAAVGHFDVQVAVRRTDQPEVDFDRLASAQRQDLPVLQYAQQPGLHRQRHIADFVEK